MKAGLIGLGKTSLNYLKGFTLNKFFTLTAVCDTNPSCLGKESYSSYPFFNNNNDIMNISDLDFVIVCTPSSRHYEIIKQAFEHHLNVVVDRPLTLSRKEMNTLFDLKEKYGLTLYTLFHWQYGEEVRKFNKFFDINKVTRIDVSVEEPYSLDGKNIKEDRISLGGSFIDSAFNTLSMLKLWLPFDEVKFVERHIINAENVELPIYSRVRYIIDGIEVSIETDWKIGNNKKITYMVYDGKPLTINHSEQKIIFGDWEYTFDAMKRKERHYYNFFDLYQGESNIEDTKKIHEAVFIGDSKAHD